jgi:hypothetical protein
MLAVIIISAQKISNVDFDSVSTALDAKQDLYKELIIRYKKADTTLTPGEFKVLYYGQCLQKDYNPYGGSGKNFDKFKEYYDKEDYKKALPFALKILDEDPMDLQMTFKTLVCYHYLNDMENKTTMQMRYENMLYVLFTSGDGKTNETAFVVMRISDEYEAMRNMEVENTMQSLSGDCDIMTLMENNYGLEKLYFNISKPFGSLKKLFKN